MRGKEININVDAEYISEKELMANDRGREAGKDNLPPAHAVAPCECEKQIKKDIEETSRRIFNIFLEKRGIQKKKVDEIRDLFDPSKIEDIKEKARQKFNELQTIMGPEIKRAAQWLRLCRREVAALKNQGLDLSGASMGSYLLVYGILFAFVIVESLANSYFIGQGSDLGLLGGAIGAFFIASLSIALSFTAGVGVRAASGKGVVRHSFALILGLMWAGGLFVYHTIIGWYRASLVYGNPDTAVSDALANFAEYGFFLPDLYSYGLAIVGLFFAGTAFVAGFQSSDARKKSQLARKLKEKDDAEANYYAFIHRYMEKLVDIYNDHLTEVENRVKTARENGHELRLVLLEIDKDHNEFQYLINKLINTYHNAIMQFRSSNLAVRDTPAPKYFNDTPAPLKIDRFTFDGNSINDAQKIVENMKDHLEELRQVAKTEKKQIRSDYETALKNSPEFIESLFRESDINILISEKINIEAQNSKVDSEPRLKLIDRPL
jgi:hypothetical protein